MFVVRSSALDEEKASHWLELSVLRVRLSGRRRSGRMLALRLCTASDSSGGLILPPSGLGFCIISTFLCVNGRL